MRKDADRIKLEYTNLIKDFSDLAKRSHSSPNYKHSHEGLVENLKDWSLFHSLDEVKTIFRKKREECKMSVKEIPIKLLDEWSVDKKTGNISHKSDDFFIIHGLKVKSEKREITKVGPSRYFLK